MATEEESLHPSRRARALARGGAAVLGAGLLVSLLSFATAASGEEAPPTVTVTAGSASLTYGDAAPAYSFSAEGFLDADGWITEPICTSDYAAGTSVAASPVAVTCSGGDAGPGYLVDYVDGAVTIAPTSLAVTAGDASVTYGDVAPTYGFAAQGFLDGDGWASEPICTSAYEAGTSVADAPLAVACSGGDAGPDYDVTYTDGSLAIAPAELTVTADDAAVTYGDAAPAYSFSVDGFLDGDAWTTEPSCTSTYASGTSAADAPLAITCSGGDAGPDYDVAYVDGTLAIAAGAITVTADDLSVTYGDAVPAYPFSVEGLLDGDGWVTEPTCTSAYVAGTPVADSPLAITCSGGDAGPDYLAPTYVAGAIAIAPATVTTTPADVSRTYGDPVPTYASSTTGFLGTDDWVAAPTCTSAYTPTTGVAASPLAITCSGGDPGANYAATSVAGKLTIARRTVTATATDVARTYGDPAPTYAFTSSGFLGADTWATGPTCTSAYTPTTGVAASPLAVTCSGGNPGTNYAASYVAGSLTIARKAVAVTAANVARTYGDPVPTYAFTATGFLSTDTWTTRPSCSSAYAPTTAVAASPLAVTCSGGNPGPNYLVSSYAGASLTIARRPVAVTGSNRTVTYGDAEPTYPFTAGALVNGDPWLTGPSCDSAYAQGSSAGTYPITCVADAGANYALTVTGATLTAQKRPITVQPNAPGRLVYGDAEPAFGFAITAGTFAPGESWGSGPVCDSNYGKWSRAGSYTANCTFAADAIVAADGTVTTANYGVQSQGRIFDVDGLVLTAFDSVWYTGQTEYVTKSTAPSDGAVQALLSATVTGAFDADDCDGGATVAAGSVTFIDGYTGFVMAKNIAITEIGGDCNEGVAAAFVTLTNGSDYVNQYKIRVVVTGSLVADNFSRIGSQGDPTATLGRSVLVDATADTITLEPSPLDVDPSVGLRSDGEPVIFKPSAPAGAEAAPTTYCAGGPGLTDADTYRLDEGTSVAVQEAGDDVALTGHVFINGDQVRFTRVVGASGLEACAVYYVVGATTNTFQLALTSGGSAISITTDGTGGVTRLGDPITPVDFTVDGTAAIECDVALDPPCDESFGQTLVTIADPVAGGAQGSGRLDFLGATGISACGTNARAASLGQEGRVVDLGESSAGLDTSCPDATVIFSFNTVKKTPKGNALVTIEDAYGTWVLKTNAVTSVSVSPTSGTATIFAKSNIQFVPDNGDPAMAYDGNVTTRIDVYEGTNKVGFTFIGSKTSILWWSNEWYKSGKKWVTAPQLLDGVVIVS